MFFFALPFLFLSCGFLLLATLRMSRVVLVRMRGEKHTATDIDFVAVNALVAIALQGVGNAMMMG